MHFSCLPPVSAARHGMRGQAGRCTCSPPARPVRPLPGALRAPVPLPVAELQPPRTARPRWPLTHYGAPGAVAFFGLRRSREHRDGPGRTKDAPPPPGADGDGARTAAAELRPALRSLPGPAPPPLPAARGVPAGGGCGRFSTADSARPVPPLRPGLPRESPLDSGYCAPHLPWPLPGRSGPLRARVSRTLIPTRPLPPRRARRAPPSPPPGCFLVPSSPSGAESSPAAVLLLTVLDRDGGRRGKGKPPPAQVLPPEGGGETPPLLHVCFWGPPHRESGSLMSLGVGLCPCLIVSHVGGQQTCSCTSLPPQPSLPNCWHLKKLQAFLHSPAPILALRGGEGWHRGPALSY